MPVNLVPFLFSQKANIIHPLYNSIMCVSNLNKPTENTLSPVTDNILGVVFSWWGKF